MRIGLTGGIGSGKSTVASLLAERGATVISADDIARSLVLPGSPVLTRLADEFGHDVILPTGELDREELAARAFASQERTAALDSIMHPLIREEAQRELLSHQGLVVYDMPLLVETGQHTMVDVVVVVDAPESLQVNRAVARGLGKEDVHNRMMRQCTREERLAAADYVVDNSGTLEELADRVAQLWRTLTKMEGLAQ